MRVSSLPKADIPGSGPAELRTRDFWGKLYRYATEATIKSLQNTNKKSKFAS